MPTENSNTTVIGTTTEAILSEYENESSEEARSTCGHLTASAKARPPAGLSPLPGCRKQSWWRRCLSWCGIGGIRRDCAISRALSIASLTREKNNAEPLLELNLPASDGTLEDLSMHYQRVETIATGGFGMIDCALDKRIGRHVVVKSLKNEFSAVNSIRSAFLCEARMMAYLDHPGIAPIHDLYEDGQGGLHLVMKFLRGINLSELMERCADAYAIASPEERLCSERVLLNERLEIFLKVCDTMAYAHYKQVIHRDLKPENIMIGAFNAVYVMDWGIAEHQTVVSQSRYLHRISGTLRYIAPEILKREAYDSRSDIYSLGVILYEIVFMQSPYLPGPEGKLKTQITEHDLRPLVHAYGVPVARELKMIVEKALMRYPEERYQNVKVLAEDIRRFMRKEPVMADESPMRGFLARLKRRLPWMG